jgi:hypothetical protein
VAEAINDEDLEETRRIPGGGARLFALVSWPSFMVAAAAEAVFFSVINPQELYLLGEPVEFSAVATYSIGFFAFWGVTGASSLLTAWLAEKLPSR